MNKPLPSSDPPADAPGPEQLALAVLAGEPDALGRWFAVEQRAVWKLCFGFLADKSAADDALQDAMLRLNDRLRTWDTRRSYRAWRNTVVLNLCRDRIRRATARSDAEERAAEEAGDALARPLPDPATAATQGEIRDALGQALGRLAQREREAFLLVELEGLSTREAADALGVGASTVRSLLTLARRRLREILRAHVPGLCPDTGRSAP